MGQEKDKKNEIRLTTMNYLTFIHHITDKLKTRIEIENDTDRCFSKIDKTHLKRLKKIQSYFVKLEKVFEETKSSSSSEEGF